MSRAKWKGPFIEKQKTKKKHNSKTIPRNLEISPKFLNLTVKVYNGKKYTDVTVSEDMLGYKFGEFSLTRSKFNFKKKAQKNK